MKLPNESQFTGCIIGQCLGDALGFIVEGYPPEVCRQYVDEVLRRGNATRLRRGEYSVGQYTDDSQLARDLMRSLVACRGFDTTDYAKRIASLFRSGEIVGRGMATDSAARRLARGVRWEEAGALPPDAGNGSAMRAAPVGLMYFDDPEQLMQVAHDQGRITHQDRRCSAGAVAIAGAVSLVLREGAVEPGKFASQLSLWSRPFDGVLGDALLQMESWVAMLPEIAVDEISRVGLPPDFVDGWQRISPFVTTSVLWSLYSFLRTPNDYFEAVSTAIAVGGDVDTTAAMTGAISGARVGLEGLPQELACAVNDNGTWGYDDLTQLARQCYAVKFPH